MDKLRELRHFLAKRIFLLAFLVGMIHTSVCGQTLWDRQESLLLRKSFPLLSYLSSAYIGYHQILEDKVSTFGQAKVSDSVFRETYIRVKNICIGNAQKRKNLTSWLLTHKEYYPRCDNSLDSLLWTGLKVECTAINRTIDVYAFGQMPNYPNIDSADLFQSKKQLAQGEKIILPQIYDELAFFDSVPLFVVSLKTALRLLELNGRMNAIDFEPMDTGANRAALHYVPSVHWSQYPYTHILVPGAGPDKKEDSLSAMGILRCRLAATLYFQKKAPFIIVSGGRVHPYKTWFSEALEMKKYLMNVMGIPESGIIIEPHARHTTTNIRNTVRLLLLYHIPLNKPGIISTTADQCAYIAHPDFGKRCLQEMKILPYTELKKLSPTTLQYLPDRSSLRLDPSDPLDP